MNLKVYNINAARSLKEIMTLFCLIVNEAEIMNFDELKKAVVQKKIDLNKTLDANIKYLFSLSNNEMRCTLDYYEALKIKRNLLNSISSEKQSNLYFNCSLKQILISKQYRPYNEKQLTKLLINFSDFSKEQILDILHHQIDDIMNGKMNFSIINSLDSTDIDPSLLQNDEKYNEMIDYLVDMYLVKFDKKDNKNLQQSNLVRYVIRMLYRHLNKGFYRPIKSVKEDIVYTYSFNAWYGDLKFMINKDKLNLAKGEDIILAAKVADGFDDFYAKYGSEMPKDQYWRRHYMTLEIQDLLSTKLEEKMLLTRTLKEE